MAKKHGPHKPTEIPLPVKPEVLPNDTPEEPALPEEPEISPEEEPNEPLSPPEFGQLIKYSLS